MEGHDGNLVLHWPLDEINGLTTVDLSGYGNDGAFFPGYTEKGTEWVAGVIGNAVRFDKYSRPVISPPEFSTPLGEQWSLAFWFRTGTGTAACEHILSLGRTGVASDGSGGTKGFFVAPNKNTGCLGAGYDDYKKASSSVVIADQQWHHAVFMRNGGSFSMTVDGVYQRQWSQLAEPLAYLEVGGG